MQTIVTRYGELTPQHTANTLRRKEILPVDFYKNGTIKSLPLEEQTAIETPAGNIPAELVTFHENGAINRVFPLNGKLSGYWSEADEAALATPLTIHSPVGPITARMISLGFHENGSLRSLTFWPGESVSIKTPVGFVETRIGVSFSPDGRLISLEPAKPSLIPTPAGEIMAYDIDAVGVNGDSNSLCFDEEGTVCGVTTTATRVKVVASDGSTTAYSPELRESLCSETATEPNPMRMAFEDGIMKVWQESICPPTKIEMEGSLFFAGPAAGELMAFDSQFNSMGHASCGL
ncbi:hypothetical protein [Pseudodesulfovibrio sp. zrk46]|uniref:hypothetical protein n=1 Tax=Pseudodesulfovibrio sp. zrk46 TaxID=2725288 RepID=UPI0014490899|nr:hypothetical protein [Pseudodesulfovibrio sp. zrk46]QJB56778.1 hypothetical protein HFN16_10340 [Pseudodesulfovibrio sp. zrk46]